MEYFLFKISSVIDKIEEKQNFFVKSHIQFSGDCKSENAQFLVFFEAVSILVGYEYMLGLIKSIFFY